MTDTAMEREIVVTRLFEAPRELVFAAFTERDHAVNWWIPEGTAIHEYDARPGGQWRFSMAGPDGAMYPYKVSFIRIDRPDLLVYDYGADGADAPDPVRTHVTFSEENGRTRVTLRLLFATAAARAEAMQYGAAAGAQQAMRTLSNYLAGL